MELYVSVSGDDNSDGSQTAPVRTLHRAQVLVRQNREAAKDGITVTIGAGTYYLEQPLVFGPEDGGTVDGPIVYRGTSETYISGGMRIEPKWTYYKNEIYRAQLPTGLCFDQLFLNREKQILARYPNYDPEAKYFGGYAPDSFAPERVKGYSDPAGGFMHAMHRALWGDFHYEITGRSPDNTLSYIGGWQNNRPSEMHPEIRYIENVLEELDSPGEWFYQKETGYLFFMPRTVEDLDGFFEIAGLKSLIQVRGSVREPVCQLRFTGLHFIHGARTFMEPMEQILRSDWCTYRGGAVFLEGCRNVVMDSCSFTELGGNAVVVSKYGECVEITGCSFQAVGASAILFVGDSSAVRSPLFRYEETHSQPVDCEPGPKNEEYPRNCLVQDNLIVQSGRVEKQSAGISLSMCRGIHLRHNTIYDVPRAGINICDGTWGGHVIEKNTVFDTVLETGDHGAFNSWGRDRYWNPQHDLMDRQVSENPELPLLDAMEPVVLRNNIFSCAYGWDIDLDDGSSNYEIVGNLCLDGGIKNREGVYRRVEHNIMYRNTFHPHVWFRRCGDICAHNLIFRPYDDISLNSFGALMDYNLLCREGETAPAVVLQEKTGMDKHSLCGDVQFVNPAEGDFRVKDAGLLERLGICQFDFSDCGVRVPALRAGIKSPFHRGLTRVKAADKSMETITLEGLKMKSLSGLGELSATGMYAQTGALLLEVAPDSKWHRAGLRPRDVLITVNSREVDSAETAEALLQGHVFLLTVWREQKKLEL